MGKVYYFNGIFLELTRRDDVISLLYMLLFLLEGGLPWMKNNDKPLKE